MLEFVLNMAIKGITVHGTTFESTVAMPGLRLFAEKKSQVDLPETSEFTQGNGWLMVGQFSCFVDDRDSFAGVTVYGYRNKQPLGVHSQ